ncbi:hypothetical protein [Streptosporangium sp. NPDC048865]|uniref:hypothetical protein n=1 Tax=Streptosporangium sp. NPDC048865 TaxID=3155766 RepID=UPI0034425F61
MAGWLSANLLLGLTIVMLGAQAPPPSPSPSSLAEAAADTPRLQPDAARSSPQATRLPLEKLEAEKPEAEEARAGGAMAEEPPVEEPSPEKREGNEESTGKAPARSRPCTDLAGGVRAEPTTISFQVAPGTGDGVLSAQVRQELRRHGDRLAGRRAGMVLTFGTGDGAGAGVRLATRVNAAIREAYPRVFGTAVTRNFHDLAAPNGSISMEIYFVTPGCSPASTASADSAGRGEKKVSRREAAGAAT